MNLFAQDISQIDHVAPLSGSSAPGAPGADYGGIVSSIFSLFKTVVSNDIGNKPYSGGKYTLPAVKPPAENVSAPSTSWGLIIAVVAAVSVGGYVLYSAKTKKSKNT